MVAPILPAAEAPILQAAEDPIRRESDVPNLPAEEDPSRRAEKDPIPVDPCRRDFCPPPVGSESVRHLDPFLSRTRR